MAGKVTPFPKLPTPPIEIDERYLSDLVRSLETIISQLQNPGPQRGTTQTLTNLQEGNDVGLEKGTLWVSTCSNNNDDGYVRIALLNLSACSGVSGTSTLGSVTVSIS